ncbi:hypothetical protein OF897_18490 [Chryseobacterium formosus]|uniref:Holin n=1 Tax=Chryseobacterium formosus TaxID=1537363 RepID=A0ABT3XW99_9FLAO|nr:hypothetical protein [Chryseobacterium formosus]MCX8525907.1 hypothetical protein [Chryseobacterium formosus]
MTIINRAKAPTPKFFRILRNIGLLSAGFGGVLIASPVELPLILTNVSQYLVLAGGIISAVSQVTVDDHALQLRLEAFDLKNKDHE